MNFLNRIAQATMALLMFAGVSANAQTTLTPAAESLSIAPGEEKEVTVNFVNDAEKLWSGVQLTVNIPEGLSYAFANEYDEYAEFGSQNSKHNTYANVMSENSQQMAVLISHTSRALADGPLFTIKVKAADNFAGGTITFTDIIVIKTATDKITLDNFSLPVEKAEPTAISNVELGTKAEKVYSLSGAERKAAVKGQLNIIRNADGTVTKVLK